MLLSEMLRHYKNWNVYSVECLKVGFFVGNMKTFTVIEH